MKTIDQRLEKIETEEEVNIPLPDGSGIAQTITVKVPAWRDPKDGEIYLDADAIAILDKAKARHLGVLAPQELATLRRRLGLTQKEIGELLQIGEKTWCRWETGRERPSRSLNLLLVALKEGKIDFAYLRSQFSAKTDPISKTIPNTISPDIIASGYSNWTISIPANGIVHLPKMNITQFVWSFSAVAPIMPTIQPKALVPSLPEQSFDQAGCYERTPLAA